MDKAQDSTVFMDVIERTGEVVDAWTKKWVLRVVTHAHKSTLYSVS